MNNKTIWNLTRTSFYVLLGVWFLYGFVFKLNLVLGFVAVGLAICTFVLSIIHLTKYDKKGLAITALVVSSYWILTFIVGFLWGLLQVME